jgi:hypothetical protein
VADTAVASEELVQGAVEAAWLAIHLDPEGAGPAPTELDNPILWRQVRAIVEIASEPGAAARAPRSEALEQALNEMVGALSGWDYSTFTGHQRTRMVRDAKQAARQVYVAALRAAPAAAPGDTTLRATVAAYIEAATAWAIALEQLRAVLSVSGDGARES